MYAVVISKPEYGLPSVVNQNSTIYPDFIMSGYTVLFEGTQKDCQEVAEELLLEFVIE